MCEEANGLKAAGYTMMASKEAGYSLKEMKEIRRRGYSVTEAAAGYSLEEMEGGG